MNLNLTLREFLTMYDDWNGYTVINGKNNNLYARIKTDKLLLSENYNYNNILDCKVIAFGFYDNELCIRIDY